jgi:hypothetical protein
MRHGPGRHSRNRNNKRNCEDNSKEPPAQYTPSANHSIVSMLPVSKHTSVYNISLFWSKGSKFQAITGKNGAARRIPLPSAMQIRFKKLPGSKRRRLGWDSLVSSI